MLSSEPEGKNKIVSNSLKGKKKTGLKEIFISAFPIKSLFSFRGKNNFSIVIYNGIDSYSAACRMIAWYAGYPIVFFDIP